MSVAAGTEPDLGDDLPLPLVLTAAEMAELGKGLAVSSVGASYVWDPTGLGHVVSDGSGDEYLWGQGLVGQQPTTGVSIEERPVGRLPVRQAQPTAYRRPTRR